VFTLQGGIPGRNRSLLQKIFYNFPANGKSSGAVRVMDARRMSHREVHGTVKLDAFESRAATRSTASAILPYPPSLSDRLGSGGAQPLDVVEEPCPGVRPITARGRLGDAQDGRRFLQR
jgi:hypothetical protein